MHLGHRFVIGAAERAAREAGRPCGVVTFDVDPDELFAPGSLKKLQSNEERIAMLASLPVDYVAVVPFTRRTASLAPRAFLDALFGGSTPSGVFVGADFRFGSKAAGDVPLLSEWARPRSMAVTAVEELEAGGAPVRSTRIRRLLAEGLVGEANGLLGRPYSFSGAVRKGRGEGAGMGFATANFDVPENRRILADGVYGGYVLVDGERVKAAISSGVPPTFEGESEDNLEAHLIGFEGDLYGRVLEVQFVERLHPMARFEDVDSLIEAVNADISWVEANL